VTSRLSGVPGGGKIAMYLLLWMTERGERELIRNVTRDEGWGTKSLLSTNDLKWVAWG